MKEKNLKHKIPNTKNSSGITLIALIITIIVLLIIAVVAIGGVADSDIIAHAGNAATAYNTKKDEENDAILGYEAFIEENLPGNSGNQGGEINNIPDELSKYILGADGEGRDLFGIAEEDDGAWLFIQDPTNLESTMHTQVKLAYSKEDEGRTLYIRYDREVYKFEFSVLENEETEEIEVKTLKDSLIKINSVTEGNLGKYVIYNGITWIILREDSEKVELISANALGDITLGTTETGDEGRNKKRIAYNTAVATLVDACKTETGITSDIRNVGGPATEEVLSESNTVVFSELEGFTTTNPIYYTAYEGVENGFRKGDTNYLSDYEQMEKLGILVTDIPSNYWISSRLIKVQSLDSVIFLIRTFDYDGILNSTDICDVQSSGDIQSSLRTCGVRPIITIDAEVIKGATQSGTILDPIVVN